jgi:hypothetical protein
MRRDNVEWWLGRAEQNRFRLMAAHAAANRPIAPKPGQNRRWKGQKRFLIYR